MENSKLYKEMIEQLVKASPLGIDTDIKIMVRYQQQFLLNLLQIKNREIGPKEL